MESPWLSRGAQTMLPLHVAAGLRSVATMFVLRRSAASYNKMRSDFYLDTDRTSCQQVGGGSSEAQYRWVRHQTELVHPQLAQLCCLLPSHIEIFFYSVFVAFFLSLLVIFFQLWDLAVPLCSFLSQSLCCQLYCYLSPKQAVFCGGFFKMFFQY